MVEIDLTDQNQKVQKLIDYFDQNLERNLDFDKSICFHGPDQNYEEEKNLKDLLGELILNESGWDRISASCRRMIICDRELDLEEGLKVFAESFNLFKELLSHNDDQLTDPKKVAQNIVKYHQNKIYEVIRYVNTCGLISYRSGDYSKALYFFKLAEYIARNPNSSSSYFIPDTTSNRIRTEFEFFSQVLPGQIPEDYVSIYGKNLIDFIDSYQKEINKRKDCNFEQDGEIVNWIYGHGMASLYHNLAEAYSFVVNKGVNDSPSLKVIFKEYAKNVGDVSLENRLDTDNLIVIFKDYAIRANETSLNGYGYVEKYMDIYRQLQSKNALRRLGCNVKEYENDILEGGWERGKLMVYQDKIKAEQYIDDAQERINEGITKKYFRIEGSADKIGILHNLNSIQAVLKKKSKKESYQTVSNGNDSTPLGISRPTINIGGKEFTPLDVSCAKIKIANELRVVFSSILYKRQVMKQIREDISLVINECIEKKEYSKALNFNDFYTNRGLIDISTIRKNDELIRFNQKRRSIEELKRDVNILLEKEVAEKKDIGDIILGETSNTNEVFLKLVLEYEDIIKAVEINRDEIKTKNYNSEFPLDFIKGIYFEDVKKYLVKRLGNIPESEDTVVVKFLIHNFEENVIIRMFLLDRGGIRGKPVEVKYPKEIYNDWISKVNVALEIYKKKSSEVEYLKSEVPYTMAELAEAFKLYDKLNGVKNIFFVPDGELFQVPLHLLGNEGTDLRANYSVYYAPTLTHLMRLGINKQPFSKKENNYLWICSPTKDLYTTQNIPCLYKPRDEGKKITLLECADGTLEEFYRAFKPPTKYTNIGFSTHSAFHNNVVTAYVSLLRFHDSFLTTYDILLFLDLKDVETIFIGACCGGLTKITDDNEAVGLVTAFLSKGADSVIAPLCSISGYIHNSFIELINKSNTLYTSQSWNLNTDNIFEVLKKKKNKFVYFVPFIQYASLDIVEKKRR
ncbi:MAG: CHAT domain-containing protein [Methanosarcina sp.]|uniref:CHAT domain-containing protein n=1 Tax=Methanosarcina sp. TaxID=2213 RepID=UPI00261058CC|nr:CHAT domain-containing protein [Methanosarcina sp.]MDD3245701.1 CHAT domain-containing protein [Methanosarcina sp.]MDD4247830.1 CHAT domain-containing protein [Methanosarcina sp.]